MAQTGDDRSRPKVTLREAMALVVGAAVVMALLRFGGREWGAEDWLDFGLRFLALAPIVTVLVILGLRSNRSGAESGRHDGRPGSED